MKHFHILVRLFIVCKICTIFQTVNMIKREGSCFMELLDYLRELNTVSIVFRVVLSILIGGVIGVERGRKHRPAGMRTYILVCLGAALVMMTNQYIYEKFQASDPSRMGAQVISGIGFLGAGTIILTGKRQIKGLTTAASLWAAACGGLAIGVGFYEGAIFGGLAIIFAVSGLQGLDNWMHKNSRYLELYIEYNEGKNAFSEFLQYAKENNFEVSNIQVSRDEYYTREKGKQRVVSYILTVKSTVKRSHDEMVNILAQAKGIQYIEEL